MINTVTGNYTYIGVQSTSGSMPYISPGTPSAGMVRYNVQSQCLEVYDGTASWYRIGSDVSVDLSPNAKAVIDWAGKKIDEERRWKEMAEKNPAIKDAYDKFKQAEEQLKIVEALVKEDNVAG